MEDKVLVNLGTDHTYECPTNIIGREGEGNTTRLEITVPEKLSGCDVYLDFEKPNKEKLRTPKLKIENGVAVYDVVKYLLTDDGELKAQAVLITDDGQTWKSSTKRYLIQNSINALDEIPEKEDFMAEAKRILDTFEALPEVTNADDGKILKVVDGEWQKADDFEMGNSVKKYGALGDGSADDTAAFKAALAAERVVFVPGGTYKLTSGIEIGDNCMLELAQDAVLNFTITSGNCITLGMLSTLKGNHATVNVPYEFSGNVLYSYSNTHTDVEQRLVPPWTKWSPQWKSGRYVTDLNICKEDSRGFHYAVNPEDCKGTAVYLSADNTQGLLTFMWGIHFSGLRIAGAFTYGIRAVNFDEGWMHEMRIDAFIDACEIGVSLEDCMNAYVSAIVQPRRAYTMDEVYKPYAKHGIQLIRSRNADLSGSRVWDWSELHTLWTDGGEYQHISMIGDCSGTILNDFAYHTHGDTRKRIHTDRVSNLETLTILQEPITKWFKGRNGDPYFTDGFTEKELITKEHLDAHFDTGIVKNFTDVLATATDESGAVLDGKGYTGGYLSGNGALSVSGSSEVYYRTTGFIPCAKGQTMYVEGMSYASYDGSCTLCMYDAQKKFISTVSAANLVKGSYWYAAYTATKNGFTVTPQAVVGNENVAYIRFTVLKSQLGDYPMIAVDEEIKYTVEGFLADGVKVKGENVIGNVGEVTPDWIATKETTGGDEVVISEQTLSSGLWSKRQMDLVAGIKYDVYVNGTLYVCEAINEDGGIMLGNNMSLTLNNVPFCIYWAGGTATSGMFYKNSTLSYPIKLKVTDHAQEKYNKMPEGYLPDSVALKSDIPEGGGGSASIDVTAEVGQTIIVKEVDASGKPTKWESADYQPRTHWQGEKVMVPDSAFEAGISGSNFVLHGGEHLIGLTIGKTYKVVFDGVTYTCVAEAGVASLDGVNMYNVISIGNLGMFGGVDNGRPFVLGDILDYAPPSWLCLPYVYGEHTLSVTGVDETNTIPEKYVNYAPAFPYYIDAVGDWDGISNGKFTSITFNNAATDVINAFDCGREIKLRLHVLNKGEETGYLDVIYDMYMGGNHSGIGVTGFMFVRHEVDVGGLILFTFNGAPVPELIPVAVLEDGSLGVLDLGE